MPLLPYVTADVFTSAPFTGNPLAVVFDADGLPTAMLQAIAREFNYSETVFVFPPDDPTHTRRVRIFTPEAELPFAGHPTVGTAFALVALGHVPADGRDDVVVTLGEGVGPVPVRVRLADGRPVHATLTTAQPPEERDDVPGLDDLAAVLSLAPEELLTGTHAPRAVSCGLPWLLVPLRSVDAVRRARIDVAAWTRHCAHRWAPWPFVFAMRDRDEPGADPLPPHVRGTDLHARAFLPGAAVPEDPATGSANAALAAYLAARTPRDGTLRWEVAQGVEMGRASRLSLAVDRTDGRIAAVRVGGGVVLVNVGTMRCPDPVVSGPAAAPA